MKHHLLLIIPLLILSVITSNCTSASIDHGLVFVPEKQTEPYYIKTIPHTLGVDGFVDLRPRISSSDANTWIGFFPFVLWIKFDSDIPDTHTVAAVYNIGSMTDGYSIAFYNLFTNTGPFQKVVYLRQDPYAKIQYRLEGVLYRSHLRETLYYYGSSFYAWFTRILGLPYVSYFVQTDLELRIRRLSDEKIVWKYRITDELDDRYHSIYGLSSGERGQNIISYDYSRIVEKHLPDMMDSLNAAIRHGDL